RVSHARIRRVDALHIPPAAADAAPVDHEIFLDAERGKYAPTLGHEPHAAAHRLKGGNSGDLRALEKDLAPPRTIEADDRVHKRCLAHSVAAKHSHELSFLEPQRQSL